MRRAHPRRARAPGGPAGAHTSCAPAGAATCCSCRRGPAGRTSGPSPTATWRSATSRSPRRNGTTCRSRSAWPSSSSTRRSGGWRPSTRARRAPPSPSCRSTPGPRSSAANPQLGTLRTRRRGVPGPRPARAGAARSATSCPSTPATSWSATCARSGGASTAARKPNAKLDAFFDDVSGQGAMTTLSFEVVEPGPSPTPRCRPSCCACGSRRPTGSASTRWRCAARSASSPNAAATRPRRRSASTSCSARRPSGATPSGPSCGPTSSTTLGVRRLHRVRPPDRMHLRLRGGRRQVPARPGRRRHPAAPPVLGHRLHPGRRRASRPSRSPGRSRPPTGCRWRCGEG